MAVLTYQLIPDTHPGSSTAQCLPSNPLLRLLHRSGTFHSRLNTWSKETTTTTKTNKNLGNFEKQNSPPDEISNSTRKIDWFSQHSQCNWNWSQPYEAQQFIPLLILGWWHGMSGAVNNATFTSWVRSHIEWACSRPVTLMVSTVAIQFYKELSTTSCHILLSTKFAKSLLAHFLHAVTQKQLTTKFILKKEKHLGTYQRVSSNPPTDNWKVS